MQLGIGDAVVEILEAHLSVIDRINPKLNAIVRRMDDEALAQADAADATRYQTVYAKTPGAVAAPTAGLHFDEAMLSSLKSRGVNLAWLTLHVGAGTFQPVRVENLAEHAMHSEWYSLPQATVVDGRTPHCVLLEVFTTEGVGTMVTPVGGVQ